MTADFPDHFSPLAAQYAAYRPTYPDALFEWLAAQTPGYDLAWDCATGNGQAALGLAQHYRKIIATDASTAQIQTGVPHPNIKYRLATAEHSGLPAQSIDLITVAQALHWFDLERFYSEVRRVLKPGGLLAVWTYGLQTVEDPAIHALIQTFYADTVGPYWPPERLHVESGYRSLPFPFDEITTPNFRMQADWTLPALLGYFRSWSATARFMQANNYDPVVPLGEALLSVWGDPATPRRIVWPLSIRAGYI
ncbi:MAG: class I SAM-dependent methyltransferase [Pseudomonadota bacterium]